MASGKLTTIHAPAILEATNSVSNLPPLQWHEVSYDKIAVARFQGMATYLDKLVKVGNK